MCEIDTDEKTASVASSHEALNQLFESQNTSQEVVLSVFELGRAEMWAYIALVEHPNSKADHIGDVLDRHRRHAARALRELHDIGLVERESRSYEGGGRGYFYQPVPVEEAKQYFQNQLDKWVVHVENSIENFDTEIETELACDGRADDCSHETEN